MLDALAARRGRRCLPGRRGPADGCVGHPRQRRGPRDPDRDGHDPQTCGHPTCRSSLLDRARHLHVGSFFLQPSLAAELPALFRAARSAGLTTSLDPNWDPSGGWDGGFGAAAAEADIVLPNATEAVRLTRLTDVDAAVRSLAGTAGEGGGTVGAGGIGARRTVAAKLGPDGAVGLGPGAGLVRMPALPVTPADTTGAGDSFDAGFLAAWLDGRPWSMPCVSPWPADRCPRAPSAAPRGSRLATRSRRRWAGRPRREP